MGLFGGKKSSSGDAVREDQIRRIQRALDEEETAIESGRGEGRAQARLSAAERNASAEELREAHKRGPWRE